MAGRRLFVFASTLLLVGLYFSFLTADYLTRDPYGSFSRTAKYGAILLCLGLTLAIGGEGHDRRDTWTLRLAFVLTAIADFVIGILGHFVAGVGVFLLVQIVYMVRHSRGFAWNRKEVWSLLLILGLCAAVFFRMSADLEEKGLFLPVLVYSLALALSLWLAIGTFWRKFFPRTMDFFIAYGMIAFFFCDLSVALASLERSFAAQLVWFFYLPAQFLLALSGFRVGFLRSVYPLVPELKEPQ